MLIKGLIFDMDGVLVDTEKYHYQAWKDAFIKKGIHLSEHDYAKYCRAQGRHNAIKNMVNNPTEEDYTLLTEAKACAYKHAIDLNDVVLYHDATELLNHLKTVQNIQLAIASSSVVAEYVIAKTTAAWQFPLIISGAMVENNKPHPDIFNLAAEKLLVPKSHLAVIEDSIAGVIAARLAGINVFAINRDHSLTGLDPIHVEPYLDALNIPLTDETKHNLSCSQTIGINALTEVIGFL